MSTDATAVDVTQTTDGAVWAAEFMRLFGGDLGPTSEIDEDLMIAWFANAIETGKRAGEPVNAPDLARQDELKLKDRALHEIAHMATGSHQTTSESYDLMRRAKQIAQDALDATTEGDSDGSD